MSNWTVLNVSYLMEKVPPILLTLHGLAGSLNLFYENMHFVVVREAVSVVKASFLAFLAWPN